MIDPPPVLRSLPPHVPGDDRTRLEEELAGARARIAAAEGRRAAAKADARAVLRAEAARINDALRTLDERQAAAIAALTRAADAEVARLRQLGSRSAPDDGDGARR